VVEFQLQRLTKVVETSLFTSMNHATSVYVCLFIFVCLCLSLSFIVIILFQFLYHVILCSLDCNNKLISFQHISYRFYFLQHNLRHG